jgi:REP element-mobilizing transposase RayT
MTYNPKIHNRQSIRLKGYDYSSSGLYFITMCVQNRAHLFGKIENREMVLNDAGKMIQTEWINLKTRFPNIELHEFVVMPDHFHGILEIVGAPNVGATTRGAPTLGDMIMAFKSITTVEYIKGVKNLEWPSFEKRLWQRNYYEHIIRDELAYFSISKYIMNNPSRP